MCIFTLAENKVEQIKSEPKFDSVIDLSQSFLGFPEARMLLTWDELHVDTHLWTVVTQEVEDHLSILESMPKKDIPVTGFQFTYNTVEGLILDLKQLHATFHKKAAENGLLSDANFQADARATIKWQIDIWNRLDKLKPRNMPNTAIPDQASEFNQ